MSDLEERIRVIEERNDRVTADKAWETSYARRGLIAVITYVFGFVLMHNLGDDAAWKHALVPVMGYLVSTFSLPPIKALWIQQRLNRKA